MKEQQPGPSPKKLSPQTTESLNRYVLAATAAGVGILGTAQAAEARVVYVPAQTNLMGTVPLDLNHDGIVDFNFIVGGRYMEHSASSYLSVAPTDSANLVLGHRQLRFFFDLVTAADALPVGVEVGPNTQAFQPPGRKFMGGYFIELGTGTVVRDFVGGWGNSGSTVAEHFLGLAFTVNGQTHFGWARVSVAGRRQRNAALTGFAYETVPNKPLVTGVIRDDTISDASLSSPSEKTGEPARAQNAMLGILALGADGLALWRRERDVKR